MRPSRRIPAVESLQEMHFPMKGLDVTAPFTQQPPGTTPLGNNVRVYDPLEMRARGGPRSGLSKYVAGQAADGYLQDINTVTYLSNTAIGSVNYSAGDVSQTTMAFSGTYILGYNNPSGGFAFSTAMAVDGSGNITVGAYQPGYPVGTDLQPLPASQQISLPANYQVVAYWQPGIFPLEQGAWQTGDQFPGLGYFANTFPSGKLDGNFGFPGADVPQWSVPDGNMPALPFWYWPSGYQTIEISINLGIAHTLVMAFGNPEGIILDPSPLVLQPVLNGVMLPQLVVPSGFPGGLYVWTDDDNPFLDPKVPFSLFGIDSGNVAFELLGFPFADQTEVTVGVLKAPTDAFREMGTNSLEVTYGTTGDNGVALVVCGLFRLKKLLLPNWTLGLAVLANNALPAPYGSGWDTFATPYPTNNFQGGSLTGQLTFESL